MRCLTNFPSSVENDMTDHRSFFRIFAKSTVRIVVVESLLYDISVCGATLFSPPDLPLLYSEEVLMTCVEHACIS